jgi:hypothetical protein
MHYLWDPAPVDVLIFFYHFSDCVLPLVYVPILHHCLWRLGNSDWPAISGIAILKVHQKCILYIVP